MEPVKVLSPSLCYTRFVPGIFSRRISSRVRAVGEESGTSNEAGSQETSEEAAESVLVKKSAGSGFGDSTRPSSRKKSSKGKVTSASKTPGFAPISEVRRRPAPTKPLITPSQANATQRNETIVEVVLLGFLGVILVEGLALAASGFLPDEWDDFLVKVVYPSFTPTVGVFVASAAGYGLYKYLNDQKTS